jgi:FkbM family methyltransferase
MSTKGMRLEQATWLNRLAKRAAGPLSHFICSGVAHKPVRMLDAYLNFLMGKGSGTGWDMRHEIQTAVSRIRREQPVVFDVGANVGEWSEALLVACPRARLYLVEPSPGCQKEILARNLKYAALIPMAVGDRAGNAKLHFASAHDGAASLHPRGDSYFQDREYRSVEVAVVTLDSVIAEHQIDFVDFLKMDIEGHELRALEGAQHLLKEKRIGALSFEFGSGDINSRTFFRDIWNFLTAYGFKIWRITPSGRLLLIEDYYEDCEYFRGATNYVAELKDQPQRSPG